MTTDTNTPREPGWFRDLPDGMREIVDCPYCGMPERGLRYTHSGDPLVVEHKDALTPGVRCYGGPVRRESVRLVPDARMRSARRIPASKRKAARKTD